MWRPANKDCSWLLERLIPQRDALTSSPANVMEQTCVLLLSRKGGKNGVLFFSYPHRPFTETQRQQSLDWAPDGEFIKCNKWRQNASSCPWWLRMDLTYTGGGGHLTGSSAGHAAPVLSELQRLFLQCHLSSAAQISIQANLIPSNIQLHLERKQTDECNWQGFPLLIRKIIFWPVKKCQQLVNQLKK